MMPVASKLHDSLQMNQKHKGTICGFLLHLLDFVNNDISIDLVPDEDLTNKFIKLIRKYNRNFVSAHDMTLVHDYITIPSKLSSYHKEINEHLMSINEQRKQKHNHFIVSANIIRSKPRREMTCFFVDRKDIK